MQEKNADLLVVGAGRDRRGRLRLVDPHPDIPFEPERGEPEDILGSVTAPGAIASTASDAASTSSRDHAGGGSKPACVGQTSWCSAVMLGDGMHAALPSQREWSGQARP